ncbi:hypothetical protein P280DRAFT_522190 [Massarina eburnea CBS 473.64]|uniref:Uncharacterized protein n=1 Tax=Massarina eburnea CBS 473.64 TaxID=1395130 RepID=A0A6A6RN18_9PLEO|nr:hypothetical protein P280DRAFT_522190 [Massarina eburnea CBS 473.64]
MSTNLISKQEPHSQEPHSYRSQRRYSLLRFILHNWFIILAFLGGLICTISVFFYIWWISGQRYNCPDWAQNCTVERSILYYRHNSTIIQGALTTTYSIGLAALLCTTCALAEAAIWPLLNQRPYTFAQLDTYLAASRGSLVQQVLAIRPAFRTINGSVLLLCIFICTALHPLGATIVGYSLSLPNGTLYDMQSNHSTTATTGFKFHQRTGGSPPLTGAIMTATNLVPTWSNGLADEPLPQYRDYLVNRKDLAKVGNTSAHAIKMEKSIQCSPFTIRDFKDVGSLYFETSIRFNNSLDKALKKTLENKVRVRIEPRLTA